MRISRHGFGAPKLFLRVSHSHIFRTIDQHVSENVEKMILGNKCDMDDKRMVTKEQGQQVLSSDCHLSISSKFDVTIIVCLCMCVHIDTASCAV